MNRLWGLTAAVSIFAGAAPSGQDITGVAVPVDTLEPATPASVGLAAPRIDQLWRASARAPIGTSTVG
jgi:hypothetical protein